MTGQEEPKRFTRRQLLVYELLMEEGVHPLQAVEAVDSTALAHPEWDMEEAFTFSEWLAREEAAT